MRSSPEGLNISDNKINRVHADNQLNLIWFPCLSLHFLDTFHTISDLQSYTLILCNSIIKPTLFPLITASYLAPCKR